MAQRSRSARENMLATRLMQGCVVLFGKPGDEARSIENANRFMDVNLLSLPLLPPSLHPPSPSFSSPFLPNPSSLRLPPSLRPDPPSLQVASLYIVIPALTIHLFFLPYEKWWHNLIEAAVLLNYIFLLLLRSTQTFLDSLESYSGTSIPVERGKGLARENDLTWLLFPFYYLPAFAGISYCLGRAVYWIGR